MTIKIIHNDLLLFVYNSSLFSVALYEIILYSVLYMYLVRKIYYS